MRGGAFLKGKEGRVGFRKTLKGDGGIRKSLDGAIKRCKGDMHAKPF